jgi:hypothetical protein
MIEDGFGIRDSPLSDSVLGYSKEVPIVQTVQVVQVVSGNSYDLNGAQRLNRAKRLNVLNNNLHSAHCRACKERVREILTLVYGECRVNHSFPWPAQPQDYGNSPVGDLLKKTQTELGNFRGHRDFIKSAQIPPCDFYISDPPFILEFDESQHFSRPRLIALTLYTDAIKLGFFLQRWKGLCREIDAKDDQPFDRDERRAWYDTLRDVVPSLHGFKPTVRLYAGDYPWCSFQAASDHDQAKFCDLLGGRLPSRNR